MTIVPADEPVPEEVRQRRFWQGLGNISSGVMLSAAMHVAILLALNIWLFAIRPGASGYVINCEILTEDDGAQTPVNTVVHAALPDEPPPGGDIRLDLPAGGAVGEGKVARIGGGGDGEGAGGGGGGVGFFGTKANGNSFVFVVDRSSSMEHDGRLIAAKQELNRAIGTLRPNQRFYVLFYNNYAHRMLEPASPAGLVFATPEIKDEVRAWLRPITPSGGTTPTEALKNALEMQPDVIFFLTDGEFDESNVAVARDANFHGTVIHTTSLVSKRGVSMLQQIAQETGGTYRHIAAADGLSPQISKPKPKPPLNVRAAEAKLRLARKYLSDGHPETGRRWLQRVVSDYPGTPQATKAGQMLSAL